MHTNIRKYRAFSLLLLIGTAGAVIIGVFVAPLLPFYQEPRVFAAIDISGDVVKDMKMKSAREKTNSKAPSPAATNRKNATLEKIETGGGGTSVVAGEIYRAATRANTQNENVSAPAQKQDTAERTVQDNIHVDTSSVSSLQSTRATAAATDSRSVTFAIPASPPASAPEMRTNNSLTNVSRQSIPSPAITSAVPQNTTPAVPAMAATISAPKAPTVTLQTMMVNRGAATEVRVSPSERLPTSDSTALEEREKLLGEIVGYGKNTTGGAHGKIYHVTTLANSGPGSLRNAVKSDASLWIVFDVQGTIDLGEKPLIIKSNKTIDGRGVRITVRNGPIQIFDAHNIIVENIKIGSNDQTIGMRIVRSNRVWIDHVSFLGKITSDGNPLYANLLAIMDGSSNITVSWSRFMNQDKGIEIGNANTEKYKNDESMYVTLHHNYMSANRRNPRVNRAHVHAFNNVVDRWACNGYGMAAANNAQLFTEGNIFTAKAGCANVCEASVSAIRSRDLMSVKGCATDKEGAVLSKNNLFQWGATLVGENTDPSKIFNPKDQYDYSPETANIVLEQRVTLNAGATR